MPMRVNQPRAVVAKRSIVLGALLLTLGLNPLAAHAQVQTCTDCVLYAGTELNLRQEPSLDAAVLRIIPTGGEVVRVAGEASNGYAPVTYDSVPGWAVELGLVATLAEVATFVSPEAPLVSTVANPDAPLAPTVSNPEARFTLTPLLLRSGPALDAEPILTMPVGATVTLTREGAENGYVTVDYDGTMGWAYAELLGGEPGSTA